LFLGLLMLAREIKPTPWASFHWYPLSMRTPIRSGERLTWAEEDIVSVLWGLMERHHALCFPPYIIGPYYPAPYPLLTTPMLHPTPPAIRYLQTPINQHGTQTRGGLIHSQPPHSEIMTSSVHLTLSRGLVLCEKCDWYHNNPIATIESRDRNNLTNPHCSWRIMAWWSSYPTFTC
jgi:hypothetical protein